MKHFTINKFIEREPTIFGMKMPAFLTFAIIVLLDGILISTLFSWLLLLIGIALLAPLQLLINYLFDKKIIASVMHENHPVQITNDI